MSASAELQKLVLDTLKADIAVTSLTGQRIYDRPPGNAEFPYVTFGPVDVVEDGADCIESGEHTLQLDVWSRAVGAVEAKRIIDAIKTVLHGLEADLGADALVDMNVGFRSILADPDGLTTHGIVRVTAIIEEND